MSKLFSAMVCLAALASFGATEYFADAVNGNDAWDGTSAQRGTGSVGPKKTVQAAVDLAVVGSTASAKNIVTLAPGDYDMGERSVTSDGVVTSNRVVITAPIILRSAGGRGARDTTRIVGRWDTSGESDTKFFMGPRAVRCVWVESNARGTRLEGLTFLHGAASWGGDGLDHAHATGGGGVAYNNYNNKDFYVIDCAFVGCIGTRGGGLYNGTAVRCYFTQCRASKFGTGARQISAYNCVFADNIQCPGASEGGAALCYYKYVVNCTFVGNGLWATSTADGGAQILNCVAMLNASGNFSGVSPVNCVTSTSGLTANGCQAAIAREIFSPATGDYRLTEGAASTQAGNMAWVNDIPAEFRDTDYCGNPRTTDGVVYCGAVQATAKSAGGSFLCHPLTAYETSGLVAVNDHVCMLDLYEQGEAWPRVVKLSWQASPGTDGSKGLIRFVHGANYIWPTTNDLAWVVAPQGANEQVKVYQQTGPKVYVDPGERGSDGETHDGSAARPWKTLQKAVAQTTRSLILAAPGDYNEGGEVAENLTNRVVVSTASELRILAVGGPSQTFITGAADTTTPIEGNAYGLGPAAVRCVAVKSGCYAAFQGFTLRNGHSSRGPNSGDNDVPEAHGAAFNNASGTVNHKSGWLLDCVVTNCVGSRGCAAYGGICERTLFVDNTATRLGVFRYPELHSCLVTGNRPAAREIAEDGTVVYNTTFVGNGACGIANAYAYNCVSASNSKGDLTLNDIYTYKNILYGRGAGSSSHAAELVQGDADFADAAAGDYRLLSVSRACNLGLLSQLRSAMDFTGRPFAPTADGRVDAGAFAERVVAVRVMPTAAGAADSVGVFRVPEEGLEISVPATGVNNRPFVAFDVNGVTQTVGQTTLSISHAQAEREPVVVTPLYLTHFFVDADRGSDQQNGSSEEQAFKTLAKASEVARIPGDVVTVLPGTYAEGTIFLTRGEAGYEDSELNVASRVAVFPGVRFESRDGAEATIVLGARATAMDGVLVDAQGCGSNAVRCAFVGDDAVLRGFTLRGGRANNGNLVGVDKQGPDYTCAGVLAPSAATEATLSNWSRRRIEDCIIDDCYSPRAGAGRYAYFRNCRILRCGGLNIGMTIRDSRLENCLVADSVGSGWIAYSCRMDGCTITRASVSTALYSALDGYLLRLPIVNTAFVDAGSVNALVLSNCAFASGVALSQTDASAVNINPLTGITDFRLDANWRPLKDSPLVDVGDRTLLPAGCETDAAGGQRVYNGALDIGCFEFDWRSDFAMALGTRKIVVDEAGPDVTRTEYGRVSVAAGSLATTWPAGGEGTSASYSLNAEVTGGGTLTVTLNGEPLRTLTQADGATELKFVSPLLENVLAFAYEPGVEDSGSALLSGFRHGGGMAIFVR